MKEIQLLGSIKTTIVDDEDFAFLSRYRIGLSTGYALIYICGNQIPLHRLLLNLSPGDPRVVDHINRNGLDNRRCNLRIATHQQNMANRNYTTKDGRCPYKGVHRKVTETGVWYAAATTKDKKLIVHGYFRCPERAALFRDKFARDRFGEFAFLNFPNRTDAPEATETKSIGKAISADEFKATVFPKESLKFKFW